MLRGLDIEGLSTGLSGITGGTVQVENCTIDRFLTAGINFVPAVANSKLQVVDTIVRNNGTAGSSGGVLVRPSGAGNAILTNVSLDNNNFGLRSDGSGGTTNLNVTVKGGSASDNTNGSIVAVTGGLTL